MRPERKACTLTEKHRHNTLIGNISHQNRMNRSFSVFQTLMLRAWKKLLKSQILLQRTPQTAWLRRFLYAQINCNSMSHNKKCSPFVHVHGHKQRAINTKATHKQHSNLVNGFDELRNCFMSVNLLRHVVTAMAQNKLANFRIHTSIIQHRCARMAAVMRQVIH